MTLLLIKNVFICRLPLLSAYFLTTSIIGEFFFSLVAKIELPSAE